MENWRAAGSPALQQGLAQLSRALKLSGSRKLNAGNTLLAEQAKVMLNLTQGSRHVHFIQRQVACPHAVVGHAICR